MSRPSMRLLLTSVLLAGATLAQPRALGGVLSPSTRPDAVVDLRSDESAAIASALWRHVAASVVPVEHRDVGADLGPTGPANSTLDLVPQPGTPAFEGAPWSAIAPSALETRLGSGRLSFHWYRVGLTLPERIGEIPVAGSTVVFEIVVDDYAEVWIDGRQSVAQGDSGGAVVRGWNAPNRVILGRDLKPGTTFDVAVLAVNAPLSRPPANYVWLRSATLDVYRPERARAGVAVPFDVDRRDPAAAVVIPAGTRLEKLVDGLDFGEGPVWHPDGYLLFSDPNTNVLWRYRPDGDLVPYRTKSGHAGPDLARYRQPGSNGLALDPAGRLTLCEHGRRRVSRIEARGPVTVLADRFEGRRLNSPNDLVYRSDGALFFTDPPFGLPKAQDDPAREQPHCGVYALVDGRLAPVATDLRGPNGIAFSPDERHLYVANWDVEKKIVMRYTIAEDGSASDPTVFCDLTKEPGEEALDGLKVDAMGNVYLCGPGGLWILAPSGKILALLRLPELPANLAFGGPDGKDLYLTARSGLYRLRLPLAGATFRSADLIAAPGTGQ